MGREYEDYKNIRKTRRATDWRLDYLFSQISGNKQFPLSEEQKRGLFAQQRAYRILTTLAPIQNLYHATTKEDNQGIDWWVEFHDHQLHRKRPLQVKSSRTGVENFIHSRKYERLKILYNGVFVINAGPRLSDQQVAEMFLEQLISFDGKI